MADEIVLHVTEANYEDTVVKSAKPVLLAIGASWCIDCKRIQPTGRTHQKLSNEPRYRSPFIGDLTRGTF